MERSRACVASSAFRFFSSAALAMAAKNACSRLPTEPSDAASGFSWPPARGFAKSGTLVSDSAPLNTPILALALEEGSDLLLLATSSSPSESPSSLPFSSPPAGSLADGAGT